MVWARYQDGGDKIGEDNMENDITREKTNLLILNFRNLNV